MKQISAILGDMNVKVRLWVILLWAVAASVLVSLGQGGAEGNLGSSEPAISGDGRFVTFTSVASNLVPGDMNAVGDVFVRGPLH